MKIVGTCSLCSGPVAVPDRTGWFFTGDLVPSIPTCRTCGAVKKDGYGPVIDMVQHSTVTYTWSPAKLKGKKK